jgi:hypothetical protein
MGERQGGGIAKKLVIIMRGKGPGYRRKEIEPRLMEREKGMR